MDKLVFDMENAVDNAFNEYQSNYDHEIFDNTIDYVRSTKQKVRSTVFWNYVDSLDKECYGFRAAIERIVK